MSDLPTTTPERFDVFLSHNSHDKPMVRQLAERLQAQGLRVWFDEWHLVPGLPWQRALETGIRSSQSVAVLVGKDGLGPWAEEEMEGALILAVREGKPVIPVLLPDASAKPELPMFLQTRTWVDLRAGMTDDALARLKWGITGKREEAAGKSSGELPQAQTGIRTERFSVVQKFAMIGVAVLIAGLGGLWVKHSHFASVSSTGVSPTASPSSGDDHSSAGKVSPQTGTHTTAATLQAALASQFGGDAGTIVPNIPSRGGRYPGAVMAVSPKGSELLVRRIDRPETAPDISGTIKGAQLSDAKAPAQLAGRAFGSSPAGQELFTVEINLQDIRIFEEEAGKLAEALRADESVNRARATGQPVVVVTKAYEAVPVVTVRQRSDTQSEDWARLKGELTQANGEAAPNNSVVFRSAKPQVVAYETSEVKFIAGSFSGGSAAVTLKRRFVGGDSSAPQPEDFGASAAGSDVAFAVFASPGYVNPAFGDLPAATASTVLVEELFQAVGAKPLETGLDPSTRLTAKSFAVAREKLFAAVKATKPRAFVFYYAGHAVSGVAGAHYLVLGDYQGKLAEDLKQTSPFAPARGPTHPLAGSNIDDLVKAIAAAGQELPTSPPGMVSVADLHRELTEAGVPFAIIVDGCYEAEAMKELREELRLTPWGDYYGAADSPMREIQEYQRALRTYGEAPYLRSANPVIFAARPGTLAPVVRHPFFDGDLIGGIGPLAAKLGGTYLYAVENREDLPLGVWLRRITDFAGTGELDVRGSISWSNFDALRAMPMVSFSRGAKPE